MIMMGDRKKAVMSILGPDSKNVGNREDLEDEGPDEMGLISQELIEAVHARNAEDVKNALRAAFACMDSEPHVEGPHEDPEG